MMFLWIIAIGIMAYVLIDRGTLKWDRNTNPLNLLDERLAKGEISMNDYLELKEELRRL